VLELEPGVNQDDVVRRANAKLEEHQKIRSASVWTEDGLPRTGGTRKLKRRELKRWAETALAVSRGTCHGKDFFDPSLHGTLEQSTAPRACPNAVRTELDPET
jgi:hypothetical protein